MKTLFSLINALNDRHILLTIKNLAWQIIVIYDYPHKEKNHKQESIASFIIINEIYTEK